MESGMEENFSPVDPEVYEEKPIKTAADRFRETVNMPDFGIPEIQTNDEIFKQAPTPIPLDIAHKLVDGAKIREDVGEQTAVAIENALTGIGGFGDQAILAFGQLTNAVTGNALGTDFMETATKNLEMRMEDMQYAEDSVGGIRNLVAQLAGGAVSMGELLLVSAATGGMGGYVQMGVQAFGEGAFNDMEKYKAEHDGSLKGYEPKSADVAINAGNAILQAVIERLEGPTPRLLTGGSRGFVRESIGGSIQESLQSAATDLAEVLKGNKDGITTDDINGWIRDGIIGGILQGGLGAATYDYNHNKSIQIVAKARAQSLGRETPNKEDTTFAKNIVNAKERGEVSVLMTEMKNLFDSVNGSGDLYNKIYSALNGAVQSGKLDLKQKSENDLKLKLSSMAAQETLNALEYSADNNVTLTELALNNIEYVTAQDGKVDEGGLYFEGIRRNDKSDQTRKIRGEAAKVAERHRERVKARYGNRAKAPTQIVKSSSRYLTIVDEKGNTVRLRFSDHAPGAGQNDGIWINTNQKDSEIDAQVDELVKNAGKNAEFQGGVYNDIFKRAVFRKGANAKTVSRAFAHYWLNSNFQWARFGSPSDEWKKKWGEVEKELGISPRAKKVSVETAERFADAYEQYLANGGISTKNVALNELLKEYTNMMQEVSELKDKKVPSEISDWFNRSRNIASNIMEKTYKDLANITMAAGVDVVTPVSNGTYVVSSMNDEGKVTSDVVTTESAAKDSKLAKFRDKKSSSKVIEGLRKATNDNIPSSEYVVLNRAETVDQARQWITNDKAGAWNAMMDDNTNPIDRTSLFQAFKEIAENGDYELGKDLVNSKISAKITEMGQAISVLGERSEFDPLNILEMKQKAIGEPDVDTVAAEIDGMNLDAEHIRMTEEQVQEIKKQTECKL